LNFVYSTTLKIGKAIYKWTLESIKFNDEMKRSQTYFTSLGLLGMKNADGTQLTIQQAKASQDKNVQTRFQKSEKVSKDFMNKLMGVSAMTGQDFNEIVSASRQGMSDLINKLSKDGKVNPYAQNPEMLNELSIRIAKMGAVLKMSDPGNRNLGYHIFPIMEALGGSNSTTGKSKGMDNAVSMRKRENIKIHEADMAYITQMVNAGKMIEAFDRLDKVMSQAGLGVEQLANMMTETLQPALDATTMFAKMFGTQLTSVLYDKARGFFKELIISLSRMSQDKRVGLSIKRISDRFAHSFDYLVLKIAGIIDRLERSPEDAEATINNIIDNFQISLQIVSDSVEGIARFMAGFLGSTDSDKSLQGVANSIHSIMLNSYKYGAKFREVANVFVDIFKVIADNAGLVATAAAALGISSVAGAAAVGAGGMATTVAATGLATAGVIAFAEAAAAIITGAAAVAAILAAIIVLGVVIKLIYEYLTRSDSNEEKAKNDARIRQETLASMTPKEREEYLKREKLANAGKGGVKPVSPTPTPTPTPTPSTKPIKTSLGAGASVAVVTPKATIDSRKSSTHTYNIASVTVIANDPKELVKQLGGKLPKTGDGAKYPASVGKGDLPDGSVG
jgi:DNA-binding phage protein